MSHRPRIGIACHGPGERAAMAAWLHAGGFEPVALLAGEMGRREVETYALEALIIDAELMGSAVVAQALRARGTPRPLILIERSDASPPRSGAYREATRLTRPLAQDALILSVSLALAEGRPARRSPRVSVPRLSSTIDGLPSQLVDVSNEGLRVELSDQHRRAVPPVFTVRIPAFNIAVVVKRVWIGPAAAQAPGRLWCGAALACRVPDEAWRTLLETAPNAGLRSQVVKLR